MNYIISNYFMQFQELNNKQWNMLEPHIPKPAHTGRPRSDDRMILNGIIYRPGRGPTLI